MPIQKYSFGSIKRLLLRYYLLVAVSSFFAIFNIIWLRLSKSPPAWDQAWYLAGGEFLYRALCDHGVIGLLKAFPYALGIKAPLICVIVVPFYLVFGHSYYVALLPNVVLIYISSYLLYKLAQRFLQNRFALFAVVVLNTVPLVFGLSRSFLVEHLLMTIVIAWMYCLAESNFLRDYSKSALLGIILGLGLLTKITFPLYVAGPSLLIAATRIFQDKAVRFGLVKSVAMIFVLGGALSATWYAKNLHYALVVALDAGFGKYAGNYGSRDVLRWKTMLTYWMTAINYGSSAYYAIVFVVILGVTMAIRSARMYLKKNWFVALGAIIWFLVPFGVFTLGVNKDFRFLSPLMPAIAILVAFVVSAFGNKESAVLMPILGIFPLICYLAISLGVSAKLTNNSLGLWKFVFLSPRLGYAESPSDEAWPLAAIVDKIDQDSRLQGIGNPRTLLLFDYPYLNHNNLDYYAVFLGKSNLSFVTTDSFSNKNRMQETASAENVGDYIVTKTGDLGPDFSNNANKVVLSSLESGQMNYRSIGSIDGPGGVRIVIYRRQRLYVEVIPASDRFDALMSDAEGIDFGAIRLIEYLVTKDGNRYQIRLVWRKTRSLDTGYKEELLIRSENGMSVSMSHDLASTVYSFEEMAIGDTVVESIRYYAGSEDMLSIELGLLSGESGKQVAITTHSTEPKYSIKIY